MKVITRYKFFHDMRTDRKMAHAQCSEGLSYPMKVYERSMKEYEGVRKSMKEYERV